LKLAAAVVALGILAGAKPKPPAPTKSSPPPASAVKVERAADGWRADLSLDRPLLGWAVPRGGDGRRELYLLTGPPQDSKDKSAAAACGLKAAAEGSGHQAQLYRWRFEAPERLESIAVGLPEGTLDAVDVDGDGSDDLILQRDGAIDRIRLANDGSPTIESLVSDKALATSHGGPRIAWDPAAARDTALRVSLLGAFRSYAPGVNGAMTLASEVAVPVRVEPGSEVFRVRSPGVLAVGRTSAGRLVFATEPEAFGKRRLRTLLLDPDGPAETRVVESWSLLPSPERMVDRSFAMLGGSPVLVVTTTSADKLSLLGEKGLRIYPLGGDRTRAGDNPMFAAETGINLWQEARPAIVDLDGDGRDDLVLAYWKGLKNAIAALEIYRGTVPSGFGKSRSISFEVEGGKKGFLEFGADVDGDGRPDLILLAGTDLLVYPGTRTDQAGDRPVESRPSRRVALPSDLGSEGSTELNLDLGGVAVSRKRGLGTPGLLDLDGDGRPEVVFAGNSETGGGRVTIVFVKGSR
jgi:hypothetical protein